jgi:signal peptidase II
MRWETPLLPPAEESPILPEVGASAEPQARPGAGQLPRIGLYWWLSLAVIVGDQAAKALIRATLPLFDSVPLIRGLVDLVHVQNAGVAFGLLNELDLPFKPALTVALALLALGGITYYARHIRREEWIARVGLSLILGGAVGNLTDRLAAGYVIDFVDVYWRGWHFWAFNVADAAITVGAILVFVDLLLVSRHASHPV